MVKGRCQGRDGVSVKLGTIRNKQSAKGASANQMMPALESRSHIALKQDMPSRNNSLLHNCMGNLKLAGFEIGRHTFPIYSE